MGKEVSAGGLAEDVSVMIDQAKTLVSCFEDKLYLLQRNLTLPNGYGVVLRAYLDELHSLTSLTEGVLTEAEKDQDKLVSILYRRKSNAEAD